jgi:hypothetical protein
VGASELPGNRATDSVVLVRLRITRRVLALAALFSWGCGGGGSPTGGFANGGTGATGGSGSGGRSGSAGEPPLGCDPTTHCEDFVCGVHTVAACGEVDCGPCRFRGDELGFGDVTAAPDGSIHLATFHPSMRTLVHTELTPDGMLTEAVAPSVLGDAATIAVAPDGTVHIAFIASQVIHAVKGPSDASFTTAVAAETGEAVTVVVDAAGDPHLLVTGEHPQTRQRQILHVTESSGTYVGEPIAGVVPIGNPEAARGADGSIALVVRSELQELAVFELVNGAFERDTFVPALDDQPAEWSIAVTSKGPEVAVLLGNYTLVTGSALVRLSRTGGNWTVTPMGDGAQVTHGLAMAAGPSDGLHLGYYARREDGLFYTRPGSPRRLNVRPQCDEGEVRIAVDAADQPHLLYSCDSGTRYLTPLERYTDEYLALCSAGAELICDRACTCGAPDCCYNDGDPDGSNGCFFGPGGAAHDLCVADMKNGLCADLTADPSALFACKPVLDATAAACFDDGYTIPEACYALLQSNY